MIQTINCNKKALYFTKTTILLLMIFTSDMYEEKRTGPAFYDSVGVSQSKKRLWPFAEVQPYAAILDLGS
jgi:hypothetical protein